MKFTKHLLTAALLTSLYAGTLSLRADDKGHKHEHGKYPLTTCVVSASSRDEAVSTLRSKP